MKISPNLRSSGLAGIKTALDDGFLYFFAGTVPEDESVALNMATTHTEVGKLSVDGDGTTGLTFEAPSDGVMLKASDEDWEGLAAFDGFADASPSLSPTFARFCADGDNGRGASSTNRLQFTVGGSGSGKEITLPAMPFEPGDPMSLADFYLSNDGA